MGICAECIYIGDKKPSPDKCRRFSENYICNNLNNAETDYITGDIILSSCRIKNQFGECLFFDDGKIDVQYFAWKKGEDLIFTKTETPEIDDKYLNTELEEAGDISSKENFYAWKNEELVYTKVDSPTLSDTVFSLQNELLGDIEAVEENKITFNSIEYERDTESDSILINSYYRSPDDDVIRREYPPEEDSESESEITPEDPDMTN